MAKVVLVLFCLLAGALCRLSPTARQIVLHNNVIHTAHDEPAQHEINDDSIEYQYMVHVSPTVDTKLINDAIAPYHLGVYLPHNTYLLVAPQSVIEKVKILFAKYMCIYSNV